MKFISEVGVLDEWILVSVRRGLSNQHVTYSKVTVNVSTSITVFLSFAL